VVELKSYIELCHLLLPSCHLLLSMKFFHPYMFVNPFWHRGDLNRIVSRNGLGRVSLWAALSCTKVFNHSSGWLRQFGNWGVKSRRFQSIRNRTVC
jgi:hypothetical protein